MSLLLEGKTDDRDLIIEGLRSKVRQLEETLEDERMKATSVVSGVRELRTVLAPLHNALKRVFGEMDILPIDHAPLPSFFPQKSVVWESWKQKLGGYTAKAIDALLLHGALTRTQLRIHVGCATSSVPSIVSALNKAGLINKDGKKISLKEL
jgi:hypothetical protein